MFCWRSGANSERIVARCALCATHLDRSRFGTVFGVAILLVYVGAKLMLHEYLEHLGFRPAYSLFVILFVLAASIILSLVFPKKAEAALVS